MPKHTLFNGSAQNSFVTDYETSQELIVENVDSNSPRGSASTDKKKNNKKTKKKKAKVDVKVRARADIEYLTTSESSDEESRTPRPIKTINTKTEMAKNLSQPRLIWRTGTAVKNIVKSAKEKTDRMNYLRSEDQAIINFMTGPECYYLYSNGVAIWEKAMNDKICLNRTPYSMKERWRRIILKNLFCYKIDHEKARHVRKFMFADRKEKEKIQREIQSELEGGCRFKQLSSPETSPVRGTNAKATKSKKTRKRGNVESVDDTGVGSDSDDSVVSRVKNRSLSRVLTSPSLSPSESTSVVQNSESVVSPEIRKRARQPAAASSKDKSKSQVSKQCGASAMSQVKQVRTRPITSSPVGKSTDRPTPVEDKMDSRTQERVVSGQPVEGSRGRLMAPAKQLRTRPVPSSVGNNSSQRVGNDPTVIQETPDDDVEETETESEICESTDEEIDLCSQSTVCENLPTVGFPGPASSSDSNDEDVMNCSQSLLNRPSNSPPYEATTRPQVQNQNMCSGDDQIVPSTSKQTDEPRTERVLQKAPRRTPKKNLLDLDEFENILAQNVYISLSDKKYLLKIAKKAIFDVNRKKAIDRKRHGGNLNRKVPINRVAIAQRHRTRVRRRPLVLEPSVKLKKLNNSVLQSLKNNGVYKIANNVSENSSKKIRAPNDRYRFRSAQANRVDGGRNDNDDEEEYNLWTTLGLRKKPGSSPPTEGINGVVTTTMDRSTSPMIGHEMLEMLDTNAEEVGIKSSPGSSELVIDKCVGNSQSFSPIMTTPEDAVREMMLQSPRRSKRIKTSEGIINVDSDYQNLKAAYLSHSVNHSQNVVVSSLSTKSNNPCCVQNVSQNIPNTRSRSLNFSPPRSEKSNVLTSPKGLLKKSSEMSPNASSPEKGKEISKRVTFSPILAIKETRKIKIHASSGSTEISSSKLFLEKTISPSRHLEESHNFNEFKSCIKRSYSAIVHKADSKKETRPVSAQGTDKKPNAVKKGKPRRTEPEALANSLGYCEKNVPTSPDRVHTRSSLTAKSRKLRARIKIGGREYTLDSSSSSSSDSGGK